MSFICNECNREFNSSKSLSLHKNVHYKGPIELKCKYCNSEFKSKQNLEKHILICKVKKELDKDKIQEPVINYKQECQKLELLLQEKEQDYKEEHTKQVLFIKEQEQKFKTEMQVLRSENYKLKESLEEQLKLNKELSTKNKDLETKKDSLYEKLIAVQENSKINHQINHMQYHINSNNSNNNNRQEFNILSTTPNNINSLLKKIDLVNNKVTSESQFAKLLEKNGVNDFFRVTDSARGIVEWVDENNNIQKEKYAEQLTNRFCDPEMAKKAKKKIEQQKSNTTDHDEIISHNKRINLCSNIGTKNHTTIKNIGKELVKNGISKKAKALTSSINKTQIFNDPEAYYSSRLKRIYPLLLKFILEKPERLLFSNPSNIGGWLGEFFSPYIISSVINREEKTCYVEMLDDEEEVCRLEDKDLVNMIQTCINGELINVDSFGQIFIQGIQNVVNDEYGFQSVVCSDEDPLDLLFINMKWLGNWFLNWTGDQLEDEEEMYKSQTKELFSMFITSVPERAKWYHEKEQVPRSVSSINHHISYSPPSLFNEEQIEYKEQEESKNLSSSFPFYYKEQMETEQQRRERKEKERLEEDRRKEEQVNKQNAILKFRYQQQFKNKEMLEVEEEKQFDKKKALNNLREKNKEDHLYDYDSGSE